jgi:uncharacterized protein (TIGR03086 family)
MTISDADALQIAADRYGELVAGVQPGQWTSPTPCDRWDVHALVNHVVMGNLLFAALLKEQPAIDWTADHLGEDPLEAYRRSITELLEAFALPGVGERLYRPPLGEVPGAVMLHLRTIEALVHGWDLAKATEQAPAYPPEIVQQELAFTRVAIGAVPREGRFADEQSVSADTPPLEQLAALLGRRV